MRIERVIAQFLEKPENIYKINFLSSLKGGWERWFQLELAYYIFTNYNQYDVSVEENIYSNNRYRLDMLIKKEEDRKHYIELKCQTDTLHVEDFASFLYSDFEKMLEEYNAGNFSEINIVGLCTDRNTAETIKSIVNTHYGREIALVHDTFVNIYLGQEI